jgi:Protein of unknown function (DUF2568)
VNRALDSAGSGATARQSDIRRPLPNAAAHRPGPLSKAGSANLALRATMEAGVVAGLGYWGYHTGSGWHGRAALAVVAPLAGFGFWGLVDFHRAGRYAEALRLCQEMAVSGLAAAALYVAGQRYLGLGLGLLSVAYHALVYVQGGALLAKGASTEKLTASGAELDSKFSHPGDH